MLNSETMEDRKTAKDWELMAHDFAMMAHKGQLDDCGRDYFEAHILHVVNIMKLTTNSQIGRAHV